MDYKLILKNIHQKYNNHANNNHANNNYIHLTDEEHNFIKNPKGLKMWEEYFNYKTNKKIPINEVIKMDKKDKQNEEENYTINSDEINFNTTETPLEDALHEIFNKKQDKILTQIKNPIKKPVKKEFPKKPIKGGSVTKKTPSDKIKCDICNHEYSRANKWGHRQTKVHKTFEGVNSQLRNMLFGTGPKLIEV